MSALVTQSHSNVYNFGCKRIVGFCICVFTQRVTCMNILKKTCSREHDTKFSELFGLVTQNHSNYIN